MKCYLYRIVYEQLLFKEGYIYSSDSINAIQKFQKSILPKFEHYTYVEFKEAACSNCRTTENVVVFRMEDSTYIMCRACRHEWMKVKKVACVGTQTTYI